MDKQKQINEIMDSFDFERVHKAMTLLQWEWGSGERASIPTNEQIRRTARRLLECAIKDKEPAQHSTGGFEAEFDGDSLTLKFVLEEYETIDD